MYHIDPAVYGSVFVLPKRLAETDLILAPGACLKALLFAFAHAGEPLTAEAAAEATGLTPADAADALRYWARLGYLTDDTAPKAAAEAAEPEAQPAPVPAEPEKKPKEAFDLKPSKPSYEMICKRLAEDPGVRELFSEAQMKLGRTIGTADQASLLLLYDYYGLPAEVILAVCEYARIHKKERNMGYIYTVGVDWSRRGIDSLEAADAELMLLEKMNTAWTSFTAAVKIPNPYPTAAQQKYIVKWTADWRFSLDMLVLAYEETLKNAGKASFPYMDKILASWRKDGIETPEQAAERERQFREAAIEKAAAKQTPGPRPAPRKKRTDEGPASYDIDRAEEKMFTTVPKLKKKKKKE